MQHAHGTVFCGLNGLHQILGLGCQRLMSDRDDNGFFGRLVVNLLRRFPELDRDGQRVCLAVEKNGGQRDPNSMHVTIQKIISLLFKKRVRIFFPCVEVRRIDHMTGERYNDVSFGVDMGNGMKKMAVNYMNILMYTQKIQFYEFLSSHGPKATTSMMLEGLFDQIRRFSIKDVHLDARGRTSYRIAGSQMRGSKADDLLMALLVGVLNSIDIFADERYYQDDIDDGLPWLMQSDVPLVITAVRRAVSNVRKNMLLDIENERYDE